MAKTKKSDAEGGSKLLAHQQPVKPIAGAPPHKGGATLADQLREIEAKFGKDNETPGLVARAGRKDIFDKNMDREAVTFFVEMVPAPDVEEKEYTVTQPPARGSGEKPKEIKQTHVVEVFDPAKLASHTVGDRISASAASVEEAVTALRKKVGLGGVK